MSPPVTQGRHSWDLEPEAAARLQSQLQTQLVLQWGDPSVRAVAGVDVHYRGGQAVAAVAVLTFPGLLLVEQAIARLETRVPYVPGLLAFREGPAILAAWQKLTRAPDLVLFDGQGIAHPRGLGLAAHMGLWLDRPTVGVAKSRLYGRHEPPGVERGSMAELRDEDDPGRVIGIVLRTRTNVRPVFVSPGNRIDVAAAASLTLACCPRFRLPEPIRWAHRIASDAARASD